MNEMRNLKTMQSNTLQTNVMLVHQLALVELLILNLFIFGTMVHVTSATSQPGLLSQSILLIVLSMVMELLSFLHQTGPEFLIMSRVVAH